MIKLIVGLGNPGAEYTATRHNAGFWLVDQLAREAGTTLRDERRFHGFYAKARLHGEEVHLLEPQTYMNRSGQSVVAVAQFFKILPDEILVEDRLSPDTMNVLRSKGHKLKVEHFWGDGECIMIDPKTGERLGASDGRNNGKAVGY